MNWMRIIVILKMNGEFDDMSRYKIIFKIEVIFMDGKVIQENRIFDGSSWSRIHNSPGTQGTFEVRLRS